jgi:hypothetical protein
MSDKENTMLKIATVVAAVSLLSLSAQASVDHGIKESVELKDGSVVHVFQDGRMGMEDRYGREFSMPEGHAMETRDGRTVVMKGNEVARVGELLRILP